MKDFAEVSFSRLELSVFSTNRSKMNSISKLTFTFIGLASFTMTLFADDHSASSVAPDAALAKLKEGNARFASSTMSQAKPTAERRAATAQGQHPFAIIVGCADSRTSPEIIFDQNIGDIFVSRNA